MCEWFTLITEINVFGKNFVMTGLPPPKLNFFSDFMWNRTILHSDYCAIVLTCTYIHPFDRILDFSWTKNLKFAESSLLTNFNILPQYSTLKMKTNSATCNVNGIGEKIMIQMLHTFFVVLLLHFEISVRIRIGGHVMFKPCR